MCFMFSISQSVQVWQNKKLPKSRNIPIIDHLIGLHWLHCPKNKNFFIISFHLVMKLQLWIVVIDFRILGTGTMRRSVLAHDQVCIAHWHYNSSKRVLAIFKFSHRPKRWHHLKFEFLFSSARFFNEFSVICPYLHIMHRKQLLRLRERLI